MIYILTGDIRSGKTTALLDWSKGRKDVDGILCPDDSHGKRYFLKIKTQDTLPLEVDGTEPSITIGKFRFSEPAFEVANRYLMAAAEQQPAFLILDEVGKLELKNTGLHAAASKLIKKYGTEGQGHLILVVRSTLVEAVLAHYGIQDHQRISIGDLREQGFA